MVEQEPPMSYDIRMTHTRTVIRLSIFLTVIAMLSAIFLRLDWSRFSAGIAIDPVFTDTSRILKRAVSLICLLMVFTTGRDSVKSSDNRLMRLIFAGIFCGDMLLLFNVNIAGIVLFFLVQILLFIRHISGFGTWVKRGERGRPVLTFVLITGSVIAAVLILHYLIFHPLFTGKDIYPLVVAYSSVLGLSLVSALCVPFTGKFHPLNGIVIAFGMTMFFLCDCTVGVRMAADDPMVRTLATSLTWVFYMPALVSLALSGYDLKRLFR